MVSLTGLMRVIDLTRLQRVYEHPLTYKTISNIINVSKSILSAIRQFSIHKIYYEDDRILQFLFSLTHNSVPAGYANINKFVTLTRILLPHTYTFIIIFI